MPSILETRIDRLFSLLVAADELQKSIEDKYESILHITNLRKEAENQRLYSAPKNRSFPTYLLEARAAGVVFALTKKAARKDIDQQQKDDYLRLARLALQIGSDCRTMFRADDKIDAPVTLVPPQQPSPVRVMVDQGVLTLKNQSTNVGVLKTDNILRVRASAAASLQTAINDIGQSANVDQRITPPLKALLKHLRSSPSKLSPEALGLNAQIVQKIVDRCKDEVPVLALIQLEESLSAVQVVLSQFEEWRLFKIAESSINTTAEQTRELVSQAVAITDDLGREAQNNALDPEIVQRLEEMISPLRATAVDYHIMIAPLYATFNNIFAGLIESVLQADITSGPLHGKSLALAALAYGYLRKYAEPLDRFPPLRFVKTSLEWIEKYLSVVRNLG